MNDIDFQGFPKEAVQFYIDIVANNNRPWFKEHKEEFDNFVIAPARQFVIAMGERFKELSPHILADPRVNGSISRIYRDTRFSPDKTPYKPYLGIYLWEGPLKKMECSGYYFHLEPPKLLLGGGIYMLPKLLLEPYRRAVIHPHYGTELNAVINELAKHKEITLGGKHYKRIPRDYDPTHENAEFLLYKGLHAMIETPIPNELFSETLVDYCFEQFKLMSPLHNWLLELTLRV